MLLATSLLLLAATALVAAAGLRAWNQWLELKRLAIDSGHSPPHRESELSGLKDRVRRLEAIARGVDF
jgi:hypothetical protein